MYDFSRIKIRAYPNSFLRNNENCRSKLFFFSQVRAKNRSGLRKGGYLALISQASAIFRCLPTE
ncbi:MAG: hypothetical protein DA408_04035 [Bacteroidetes bacterium]|nr:MAG: hypothetical protein C7N36_07990 [Bacteroidota bacterium]PTM14068.1 MAG: hypothetical protein DA408_04035 [Bacteroidota bacterium]